MEEKNTGKLNNVAADLPEVPRTQTGEIDLEAITLYVDEKGNKVVDDYILEYYYRELPKGIINKSGTWRSNGTGGKLKILGGDPEADKAIQIKGANTLNATLAQQRSYRDRVNIYNRQKVPKFFKQECNYDIPDDADMADAQILAQQYKAIVLKDTKAAEFLRDTAGEKPVNEISATVEEITPEDKELLQRVNARLNSNS